MFLASLGLRLSKARIQRKTLIRSLQGNFGWLLDEQPGGTADQEAARFLD
jgi:hypothetical protein